MLTRRTGDREHVVERHRHVGDNDLPCSLGQRLGRGTFRLAVRSHDMLFMPGAQLTPHLPADPQQQEAAREQQSDNGQKLGCKSREDNSQKCRGANADQDCLVALPFWQTRSGKTDDNRIVTGKNKVDEDDLNECS